MRTPRFRSRPIIAIATALAVAAGAVSAAPWPPGRGRLPGRLHGGASGPVSSAPTWTSPTSATLTGWKVAWSFTAGQTVTSLWNGW